MIPVDGGPPIARCKLCGTRDAAGPCARCRSPVCGDCCELTTGGATTFAICLTCAKRSGSSLASGWSGLLVWLALIIIGVLGVGGLLMVLR